MLQHHSAVDDGNFIRVWNGQTIKMRAGRICLTDLCKAGETAGGNAIRYRDWFESEPTQRFLAHRAEQLGVEVFSISRAIDNAENSALVIRENERGDAWGDKVVALKLAARLCTALEHEVYSWYAEQVDGRAPLVRDTRPSALAPAFVEKIEAAELLSDLVSSCGGDKAISLARSLTVIGRECPEHKAMCFEQQRLLCPSTEDFVNVTVLGEELVIRVGKQAVDKLTEQAKEQGVITTKRLPSFVNQVLVEMGLQRRGDRFKLSRVSWVATKKGQEYSREETRPAQYAERKWVPQLLWEKDSTVKEIILWLKDNSSGLLLSEA